MTHMEEKTLVCHVKGENYVDPPETACPWGLVSPYEMAKVTTDPKKNDACRLTKLAASAYRTQLAHHDTEGNALL